MRLDDLRGRHVALLGMGIDVRAALPAIVAAGPSDVVVVDDSLGSDQHESIGVVPLVAATRDAEILVRSPGFPRYAEPISDALARGTQMTTPVEGNVHALAMDGDFDDCQARVKDMFNDFAFRDGVRLAGVNSHRPRDRHSSCGHPFRPVRHAVHR